MKATCRRIAAAVAMALPACCLAQMPSTPLPWQAVVDAGGRGLPPTYSPPSYDSRPLAYGSRPWDVTLVVAGRDPLAGAFCRGSVVRPGWILTAASCVCSMQSAAEGMEVILERETGTARAKRVPIVSTVTVPTVWLFQDDEWSLPDSCVTDASKLLPGVASTLGSDLALIRLADKPLDQAQRVEMLGAGTAQQSLLFALAKDRIEPQRRVNVGLVFVGQRDAGTFTGRPDATAIEFVLDGVANPQVARCDNDRTTVATVHQEPPAGTIAINLCADLTPGRLAQGRGGTGVVLSDHRRPLLLGVFGNGDSYTSLIERVDVDACTVAKSVEEFMADESHDPNPPQHQCTGKHWFALHRPPYDPSTDRCQTDSIGTFGGVEVFLYKRSRFAKPAYVFRQKAAWIDVRGAPNSYHPDDRGFKTPPGPPPWALDKAANAGWPDGDWSKVLAKDKPDDLDPFRQTAGPNAGFYVSMTRLQDDRYSSADVRRYVNAAKVPYVVFNQDWFDGKGEVDVGRFKPGAWAAITGPLGAIAVARLIERDANGTLKYGGTIPAIVADVDKRPFGGISQKLAQLLASSGGARKLSAADGIDPPMDVMFMVFPDGGLKEYHAPVPFSASADEWLRRFGGWPDAEKCLVKH